MVHTPEKKMANGFTFRRNRKSARRVVKRECMVRMRARIGEVMFGSGAEDGEKGEEYNRGDVNACRVDG